MKDINLLPDILLYRKRNFLLRIGKSLGLAILIAGAVTLLLLPTYRRLQLQKQINETVSRLATPELEELNALDTKLSDLKKEYSTLEALSKNLPSTPPATDKVLSQLTTSMTAGMTASQITYRTDIRQISLQLAAGSREDIALFLKRLHDSPLFSDIHAGELNGAEAKVQVALLLKLK